MVTVIQGRPVVRGKAEGEVLLAKQPISIWGGVDPKTGQIIDCRHDRHGEFITARIFALPAEIGSSTGSAVLLELIRIGKAPAAIVTQHVAPILALGAILAEELYGSTIPVLRLPEIDYNRLRDGEVVRISEDGAIARLAE